MISTSRGSKNNRGVEIQKNRMPKNIWGEHLDLEQSGYATTYTALARPPGSHEWNFATANILLLLRVLDENESFKMKEKQWCI